MVRSVRYLILDAGVGSVGVRAVGVGREEQHGLKQGTVEEQHTGAGEKLLKESDLYWRILHVTMIGN